MRAPFATWVALLAGSVLGRPSNGSRRAPFLEEVDGETWVIGNELWNMTQGRQYGVKLYYKDHDCVGDAVGHYVSYNGAASDLNWTSASVAHEGTLDGAPYIDVKFTAREGDMHWIIVAGLAGAYQYFVNHDLPVLGEFRTLWRLDNTTFTHGKTDLRDEPLPPLSDYRPENKVQDETWRAPGGDGYITKYDLTSWVRTQTYYGVYGDGFGSWYINAGKDYYNGNHLKQELMIHRESATGDAVELNMIHGTHFQVSAVDAFPDGKMWGPWLWYLNDGSKADAEQRAEAEFSAWPYTWFADEAYHKRGSVRGKLVLSDGRPAAHAAVFLGDDQPNKTALDMGSDYYYTGYADADGAFTLPDVRVGTYGLQAWSNGSRLADVTTSFLQNGVVVAEGAAADLGTLRWAVSNKTKVFQVGDFDRTSYGFRYGGAPYEHGAVEKCPADLTFTAGQSAPDEWCFGQSKVGTWTVAFELEAAPSPATATTTTTTKEAVLIVSLAGYSAGVSADVWANDVRIGNLTSGGGAAVGGADGATASLLNDPSVYRSATTAGEWRYFEFAFDAAAALVAGRNEVRFQVTRNSTWRGFMWDSVVLEW